MEKTKKQLYLLIGILVVIGAALAYMFSDVFLPSPTQSSRAAAPQRWPAAKPDTTLFTRADFVGLKKFGDIPVRVNQQSSTDPFKSF